MIVDAKTFRCLTAAALYAAARGHGLVRLADVYVVIIFDDDAKREAVVVTDFVWH